MFARLARVVADRPGVWVFGWVLVVGVLFVTSPSQEELSRHEPHSLLPPDQPYNRALEFEQKAFPELASQTRTVLIFVRQGGLTPADETALADLTRNLEQNHAPQHGGSVQSPFTDPRLIPRLRSADGDAAMIVVSSDSNYLTNRSVDGVDQIESIIREFIAEDLHYEITGEGGLGRDLAVVTEEAFHRTTKVTIVALLLILAVVYRAPVALFIPLATIGLSVVAALMVINQLTRVGWSTTAIEKTLIVVLLFGAGTDFALFWLSAYREQLSRLNDRREAAVAATSQTGPAIVGSAATTICGLMMLMAADLIPSYNAGRAMALSLAVALAAALTLVPAMALLMGRTLFWPKHVHSGVDDSPGEGSRFWHAVANLVTTRPKAATLVVLLLMAGPAVWGWRAHYTYDALGVIPAETSAERGRRLAEAHFTKEQLFAWNLMIRHARIGDDLEANAALAGKIADLCLPQEGVVDVWSLAAPLGAKSAGLASVGGTRWAREQAAPYYVDPDHHVLRLEVMQDAGALSTRSMHACAQVMQRVRQWLDQNLDESAALHATGLTPYILNIKSVADADHHRVIRLVLAVILVIVCVLVRDLALALVMLAATVVVFLVTIGVTERLFVTFAGMEGIDWKVRLFAFVILVAVGQDYNIFLVTRLLQERSKHPPREAARRAIIRTGAVISSCGAIMAATLGSLASTGLAFFQELGIAFAFGVLVDTFIIRPVLVPAAYLLLRGKRRD